MHRRIREELHYVQNDRKLRNQSKAFELSFRSWSIRPLAKIRQGRASALTDRFELFDGLWKRQRLGWGLRLDSICLVYLSNCTNLCSKSTYTEDLDKKKLQDGM